MLTRRRVFLKEVSFKKKHLRWKLMAGLENSTSSSKCIEDYS